MRQKKSIQMMKLPALDSNLKSQYPKSTSRGVDFFRIIVYFL